MKRIFLNIAMALEGSDDLRMHDACKDGAKSRVMMGISLCHAFSFPPGAICKTRGNQVP